MTSETAKADEKNLVYTEEGGGGYDKLTQKDHDGKVENGIPSSSSSSILYEDDDTVYTYQDPNFYDYTRLSNFTKKTGIEADDFSSFALKELIDNAADFLEVYYKQSSSNNISVYISNDNNNFRIAVINPNDGDVPIFPIHYMKKTFNYSGAFSSKNNQYRNTRGAQGITLKQLGMLAYILHGKNWKN